MEDGNLDGGAYGFQVTYVRTWKAFLMKQEIFQANSIESGWILGNIAYSLHYLQYLDENFRRMQKLPTTLKTMNAKTFLITGGSIIEALFFCLLHKRGLHKTTEWQELHSVIANDSTFNGETLRVKTTFFKRLDEPKEDEMTFDAMTKKIESKKLLGSDPELYKKISGLRKLRNRIHIQEVEMPTGRIGTDWHSFNPSEVHLTQDVVLGVCEALFQFEESEKNLLDFLRKEAWTISTAI